MAHFQGCLAVVGATHSADQEATHLVAQEASLFPDSSHASQLLQAAGFGDQLGSTQTVAASAIQTDQPGDPSDLTLIGEIFLSPHLTTLPPAVVVEKGEQLCHHNKGLLKDFLDQGAHSSQIEQGDHSLQLRTEEAGCA